MVMAIVDTLGSLIHRETYASIKAEKTSMEQMRLLYIKVDAAGIRMKAAFYNALQQHEPDLLESLGKNYLTHSYLGLLAVFSPYHTIIDVKENV